MIRSKQIKEVHSFDEDKGTCILVNHKDGRIKVGIRQCDEELVNRVLAYHTTLKNDSEESIITAKKWWQFWKRD